MAGDLDGRRILVPESRELDLFVRLLEAQGAAALRCPLVAMLPVEDPAPVEAWLGRLIAGGMDDLILLTGEGLRRLVDGAREKAIEPEMVAALGRLRTVTRGPKPGRVLRTLGLAPTLAAPEPTTAGVIAALEGQPLAGRRVGVQLYPGTPNEALIAFLRRAGAEPDPVLPYRYASDAESDRVAEAIRDMAAGRIDLVAFTSSPQVRRLAEVARERGLAAELREGLARVRVAAVGPVVAEALAALGARVDVMSQGSFHLKPLVNAIRAAAAAGEV